MIEKPVAGRKSGRPKGPPKCASCTKRKYPCTGAQVLCERHREGGGDLGGGSAEERPPKLPKMVISAESAELTKDAAAFLLQPAASKEEQFAVEDQRSPAQHRASQGGTQR
jgi:hypothetical protein